MNDIDTYLTQIKNLIEIWDNESPRSLQTAKELNLKLTFLKVMIGIGNFNELDAFNRYMRETSKFLNQLEGADKNEKKLEIF